MFQNIQSTVVNSELVSIGAKYNVRVHTRTSAHFRVHSDKTVPVPVLKRGADDTKTIKLIKSIQSVINSINSISSIN